MQMQSRFLPLHPHRPRRALSLSSSVTSTASSIFLFFRRNVSNAVLLLAVNDVGSPDVKAYSAASPALICYPQTAKKSEHLSAHMEEKPQDFRLIKMQQDTH